MTASAPHAWIPNNHLVEKGEPLSPSPLAEQSPPRFTLLLMVLLLSLLAAACGTTDTGTADDASPDVADADDGADNGEEADDESDPEDDAAADNSADESADDSTDDSVDEPTEPAGAASSGDVPGVTEDSILLGTTLPITGVAAAAGEGLLAGITIALDEANAEGGIDGRMLELVALDDGFDPPRLVSNARRLI